MAKIKFEGKRIDLRERVTVYGTGKANSKGTVHMVLNKAYEVHPMSKEKLIAKGYAKASKSTKQ